MNKISSIPTIVVIAYNRISSLQRLLQTIKRVEFDSKVNIVISIDQSSRLEPVTKHCNEFHWEKGIKTIISHKQHMGLVRHVFFCMSLAKKYGSVIILEDDHYVSPMFLHFAVQTLNFLSDHPETQQTVAGVSLFSILKNGFVNLPFFPLPEGSDVFYAQVCVVHGFVLTQNMWSQFEEWYNYGENRFISASDNLHSFFKNMDDQTEWFQTFTNYLVKNNKCIVYPREAYCLHFQEPGTHFTKHGTWFQNPLQVFKRKFKFKTLEDSIAVYDSFLEIKPHILKNLNPDLQDYPFSVDFYTSKSAENIKTDYVLTTRPIKNSDAKITFGRIMMPFEMNVIEKIPGKELKLAKKKDVKFGYLARHKTIHANYYYFYPGRSFKLRLLSLWVGILDKLHLL